MNSSFHKQKGFTLIELIVSVSIVIIITAAAAVNLRAYLPKHKLTGATRAMYSDLQRCRLLAIKNNTTIAMIISNVADGGSFQPDQYSIYLTPGADGTWSTTSDNSIDKTILLNDINNEIGLGIGNATKNIDNVDITAKYTSDGTTTITFSPQGTSSSDSIYLQNKNKDTCYQIAVSNQGAIKSRKYDGTTPFATSHWDD